MAIASSRYYNNPQMGQAFQNLASMFAPPSGSDLAGYAVAGAKRAEAQRLADLFTYAQSQDGFNQGVFDRMGQATGQWTPSTGYYGVDTTAETARRGQDVTAQTTLATNAADNARALEANRLDNQRSAIASLYGALNPGQIAPAVPADVAALVGLPATAERVGAPNPLSETQWQAQQNERLRNGGQLTDQMLIDNILGERTPVRAAGPDGAVFMSPGEAVRTGAQPAPEVSSAAPETQNYQTPDGARGTAVFDQVKRTWVDTATGQPLPQGAITFNSSLQGGAADTGLGPTTANSTSANDQAAQITQALNTLDLFENLVRNNPAAVGFSGMIRGTAQNAVAAAQDLAGAFGGSVPQAQQYAAEIRSGLSSVAPELFDPDVNEANFLQGTLAYAIARTENPDGEVSRQAYERALERISGGMLSNSQSIMSNIAAYRKVLNAQLPAVGALRDPATARTDTNFQQPAGGDAPVERWIRGPDGRPMRAQ